MATFVFERPGIIQGCTYIFEISRGRELLTLFSRRNVINGRKDLRCMHPFLCRSGLSKDAS